MGVNEIVNPDIRKSGRRRPILSFDFSYKCRGGVCVLLPHPTSPMLDIN
jgi:hypothetical protein